MSASISITSAPVRRQPVVMPQAVPQKSAPQADRVIVKPKFMGDTFVCVPERVPTTNPDGSPIPSPTERFLDWLFGSKS